MGPPDTEVAGPVDPTTPNSLDANQDDWKPTPEVSRRTDWVSWFVDGRAQHFRADSPSGIAILAALAEVERPARRCAVVGCSEHARGRSRACSDSHARALRRGRDVAVRTSDGPALPDSPETRTFDADLPGATRAIIADTADASTLPERQCANCGADISSKRRGAVVCGDACRKAIARRARTIAASAEISDVLGQPQLFEVTS